MIFHLRAICTFAEFCSPVCGLLGYWCHGLWLFAEVYMFEGPYLQLIIRKKTRHWEAFLVSSFTSSSSTLYLNGNCTWLGSSYKHQQFLSLEYGLWMCSGWEDAQLVTALAQTQNYCSQAEWISDFNCSNILIRFGVWSCVGLFFVFKRTDDPR